MTLQAACVIIGVLTPISMQRILALLGGGILLTPTLHAPAIAHRAYNQKQICYKNVYKETYHPGTRAKPGYVTSKDVMVERKCPRNFHAHGKRTHKHKGGRLAHTHHVHSQPMAGSPAPPPLVQPELNTADNNSCIEGTVAGGVLGGALGGTLAKKDNWIWSIPTGAVAGAIVGCQVDGG